MPVHTSTPKLAHTHNWVPDYDMVHNEGDEEVGHYEMVWVGIQTIEDREASDRLIYERHEVCTCGAYVTSEEEIAVPPSDETVIVEYHCSGCGAMK